MIHQCTSSNVIRTLQGCTFLCIYPIVYSYTKGATQWIYIQYDSPNAPLEDLLIRTDMTAPYTTSPSSVKVTQNAYGILTVEGLKAKGDTVMIYSSSGSEPDFSIAPVAPQEQFLHYWGYHSKPSSVESFRDLPKDVTVISVGEDVLDQCNFA